MWHPKDSKYILIDFGVSKVLNPAKTGYTGTILGSQGYSPPEQIVKGQALPSSDLFSLGASCFYLLSGISPFDLWLDRGYSWLENWQNLIEIDLNPQLTSVLDRMLQKDVDRRYQSAAEVINDLQKYPAQIAKSQENKKDNYSAILNRTQPKTNKFLYINHFIAIAMGVIIATIIGFYQSSFRSKPISNNPQQKLYNSAKKIKIFAINPVKNIDINSSGEVWSLAISPNGNIIASGSHNGTIDIYDRQSEQRKKILAKNKNVIRSLVFINKANNLVGGDSDGNVNFWDLKTGKLERQLPGHIGSVWSLAVSPDGQSLVSSGEDKSIRIWDLKTGEQTNILFTHSARVFSLAFTPDAQMFASSSADNTIKIWDANNGQLLKSLSGHQNAVRSIAITPDGKYLVSGSWDKTIKIWELTSGKLISTLEGHKDRIVTVAVSKDSQIIFSGSIDNTIKIWSIENARLIDTLDRHSDWILALASSPQENLLVSAGKDRAIELWQYKYTNQEAID